MNTDKLIHKANQIASFFRSYPDDQAITGIHDHLVAFWTPGMRSALVAVTRQDGHSIDPLVAKALITFEPGKSPSEKEVSGPATIGDLGSDAG
ncbi:formate dehydrogenase subunit delta [Microvirga zambiensis]|uniref:formate dehydrogenase subunit delta n=1 Tax=Microvirga zambiensis TaxID=1402137 RepID=UPI00191D34E8|nr:formate dehydrogenase subunit delta [Microvirga zambiensis]